MCKTWPYRRMGHTCADSCYSNTSDRLLFFFPSSPHLQQALAIQIVQGVSFDAFMIPRLSLSPDEKYTLKTSPQAGVNSADPHTGARMANALLDPRLSRGEVDYQFRVRQLEGELSVQSKLTAELEQSNAQLQQQIFQADQTKIQLHKRCSHLYDLVRAQLKEKRGNNEEITLLRDQLHELRGQHQRLLAERLEPAPSLPHGPDSEWVDVLGGGLIPENVPRNASFQAFNFPEGQQRPPLSRMESSDLSPAEKEAIRTRMLTDRGPTRAFSVRDGGAPSPHGEADRERSGEASPERATGGPSRGIKVEASARVPEEVDSSLPSRRGNGEILLYVL